MCGLQDKLAKGDMGKEMGMIFDATPLHNVRYVKKEKGKWAPVGLKPTQAVSGISHPNHGATRPRG